MKEIKLTRNKVAIVDDEDYENLSKFTWHCSYFGYAERATSRAKGKKRRIIKMHREVLRATRGQEVDHINGDRLDNRKENLRFCTNHQNRFNQKVRKDNTSGFKGVYWDKAKRKWYVSIAAKPHRVFLGYFDDKEDGAKAYNAAAKRLHGSFARLNCVGGNRA